MQTLNNGRGVPNLFPVRYTARNSESFSGDFVRKSAKNLQFFLAIFVFPHVSDRQSLDECSGREKNSFYLTMLSVANIKYTQIWELARNLIIWAHCRILKKYYNGNFHYNLSANSNSLKSKK